MQVFTNVYSILKSFSTYKAKTIFADVKGFQFHRIPIKSKYNDCKSSKYLREVKYNQHFLYV